MMYYLKKILQKIFRFNIVKKSKINRKAKLSRKNHLLNSELGEYSYIGNNTVIIETKIGKFCSIANNCIIGGGAHPISFVSTSPVFCEGRNILKKNFSKIKFKPYKKTILENDVWIGSNCLIKAGVTIGNGAIIGMGSVVTKNIPPYEIWAGNPAKCIRKRFDDVQIEKLLQIKWWDFKETDLKIFAKNFNSVDSFIENLNEEGDRL